MNSPEQITQQKTIAQLKTKRILLVEDNEINQLVTNEMLCSLGYLVDIADNGKNAVDMVNSKEYDLILMDLQMPVMDGYTAASIIRGQNYKMPIIALSADILSEFQEMQLR